MALTKCLSYLSRIGFNKWRIAIRQIHAEVMKARQLTVNDPIRFAKIHLCMPRLMAQRNKYLAAPQLRVRHVIPNYRDAASKAVFIAQPLKYP